MREQAVDSGPVSSLLAGIKGSNEVRYRCSNGWKVMAVMRAWPGKIVEMAEKRKNLVKLAYGRGELRAT